MKIAEDLFFYSLWKPFRMILGRGASCNVFALKNGEEIWLIDVGTSIMGRYTRLIRNLKDDGLDPGKITKIFLTHGHLDHINALGSFLKQFDVEILIHEADGPLLEGGEQYTFSREYEALQGLEKEVFPIPMWVTIVFSRYSMGRMPRVYQYQKLVDEQVITGDNYSMKCLHTPGHTPGHACFYIPERKILFNGDLFDPNVNCKPPVNFPSADFDQFYQSLEKVQGLAVEILCMAHMKKVHEGNTHYRKLVSHAIKNLDDAREITINLLKQPGGMRLKHFNGHFPKDVFNDYPEQISVAYGVIKSLRKTGNIRQERNLFFYQQ